MSAAFVRAGEQVVLAPERDAADFSVALMEAIARRRPMRDGPFGAKTTDEIMRVLRGDD